MTIQVQQLDVRGMTANLQAAVQPLFWAGLALAFFLPIAAAGGAWVSRKISNR